MIRAWRLGRRVHCDPPATRAFDGRGSQLYGNRWNSVGLAAAYAASSRSLCALEYLVHVDPDILPADLVFAEIAFRDLHVERVTRLPSGWDEEGSPVAAAFGDAWLRERRSVVLEVPSVIVRDEMNYVINPLHPEFSAVEISPVLDEFVFDARLFARKP